MQQRLQGLKSIPWSAPDVAGTLSAAVIVFVVLLVLAAVFGSQASAACKPTYSSLIQVGPVQAGGTSAVISVSDANPATVAFTGVARPPLPSRPVNIAMTLKAAVGVTGVPINGLKPNTPYTISLQSVNNSGSPTNSTPLVASFTTLGPSFPGPVTNLTVTDVTGTQPPVTASGTTVPGWSVVMVKFNTPFGWDTDPSQPSATYFVYVSSPITEYYSQPAQKVPSGVLVALNASDRSGVISTPITVPGGVPVTFVVTAQQGGGSMATTNDGYAVGACYRPQGPSVCSAPIVPAPYGGNLPLFKNPSTGACVSGAGSAN